MDLEKLYTPEVAGRLRDFAKSWYRGGAFGYRGDYDTPDGEELLYLLCRVYNYAMGTDKQGASGRIGVK